MNKLWLTLITLLWSFVSIAQQNVETSTDSEDSTQNEKASFFAEFSCVVKNSNTVEILWRVDSSNDGDYFIVERSLDGQRFETVSALKITDTSTGYGVTDNSPINGTDFYRIKYISKTGGSIYSKVIQVTLSADVDFKFYPNPVDKLLIIRTSHNIDIQVMDQLGTLRLTKQLQPGLQVINISTLEKGSYILKIADKESNRVVSEQLLKN